MILRLWRKCLQTFNKKGILKEKVHENKDSEKENKKEIQTFCHQRNDANVQ
jgi:hypothetical protein